MQCTTTPVKGLTIYENFMPQNLHDAFSRVMKTGKGIKAEGNTYEYTFPDDNEFDEVFTPLISLTFQKLKELKLFPKEKLKLGCTLIGYKKDGYIKRHIDSPLLSGETVVVMSFNSVV